MATEDHARRAGAPTQPSAPSGCSRGSTRRSARRSRTARGPLLVLAGAGSGKTRVLTHRVAHLVATGQAKPSEILAITFTNKAAREMRDRVEGLVGRMVRVMWVMTFHSACARILRAEAERLGYTKRFSIYDDADSVRLVRRCLDELAIDPKRFAPRAIKSQISRAKNQLEDAAAYREQVGSFFEQTAADVYELYEKRIHEMNAVDFDDLLFRTVNLLELFPDVAERYRRTFRWILVDEYQDTNHAQYRLLQLLAGEERNVCVVGDDDQSIYGFRGADINNILDFERDFPGAHVVKLEQNYRSTQTILSAANAVVVAQRGPQAEGALDRRAARATRCTSPSSRTSTPRRATSPSEIERLRDEEGISRERGRGLLPDQRAEPRAGGHARARRRRVPGDRRHQVLRARRDQGRARLPDAADEPAPTRSRSRAS